MTDRVNGVWVALEKNVRVDDVEPLLNAIRMLRGVQAVEPHVTAPVDWIAESRAKEELRRKLLDVLFPEIAKP